MEIRYRLYPYPVLASFLPEVYKTSYFKVVINEVQDGYNRKLMFTAYLKNRELQNLIEKNKANYVYHLECAQTGFRKVIETKKECESYTLEEKKVKGRLQICAFIVAKENLQGFTSEDFDEDYSGLKFDIDAGCVLAVNGSQISIDIVDDFEDLANTPSIFSIIQNQDQKITEMKIDYFKEKIVILLPYYNYTYYKSLNQNAELQSLLTSLVIMPALVYILDIIKNSDGEAKAEFAQNCGWYRTIRKTLKTKFSCDIENGGLDEQDSLELAQKIINNPLTDALKLLVFGNNNEEGDE